MIFRKVLVRMACSTVCSAGHGTRRVGGAVRARRRYVAIDGASSRIRNSAAGAVMATKQHSEANSVTCQLVLRRRASAGVMIAMPTVGRGREEQRHAAAAVEPAADHGRERHRGW